VVSCGTAILCSSWLASRPAWLLPAVQHTTHFAPMWFVAWCCVLQRVGSVSPVLPCMGVLTCFPVPCVKAVLAGCSGTWPSCMPCCSWLHAMLGTSGIPASGPVCSVPSTGLLCPNNQAMRLLAGCCGAQGDTFVLSSGAAVLSVGQQYGWC
jgi:hypothetical protein